MNSIVTINTKFPRFILCPPCLDNTCSEKNRSLRLTFVSLYKTKHLNDLQDLIIVVERIIYPGAFLIQGKNEKVVTNTGLRPEIALAGRAGGNRPHPYPR